MANDLVGNVVVIGGGHMGSAIARMAYAFSGGRDGFIAAAEPDEAKRRRIEAEESGGIRVFATAREAVEELNRRKTQGRIVLAVKPQVFPTVAAELVSARLLRDQLVISIMAGVSTRAVYDGLGGGRGMGSHVRVVRAMPNLAIGVGEGMTAVCAGPGATAHDLGFAKDLFGYGTEEVVTIDESLFDAFTAIAGSGPAYLFYLAEGMMRAGAELGFDAATTDKIVRQTIFGAATMLCKGTEAPAAMRAAVTSKGGTTEAAVRVLDGAGVMEAVVRAIGAGRDRGRELAGG